MPLANKAPSANPTSGFTIYGFDADGRDVRIPFPAFSGQNLENVQALIEAYTKIFTQAEKNKLGGLDSSLIKGGYTTLAAAELANPSPLPGTTVHVDAGVGEDVDIYVWDATDSEFVIFGSGGIETPASIYTKLFQNLDIFPFDEAAKDDIASKASQDSLDALNIILGRKLEADEAQLLFQAYTKIFTQAEKNKLAGLDFGSLARSLSGNQTDSTISILDADGNVLDTLAVGWLNNEATSFSYNETDNTLDLINDDGTVLSQIPIASFLQNLANNLAKSGTKVQLRDSANAVLSEVELDQMLGVANVAGLVDALALKADDASSLLSKSFTYNSGAQTFTADFDIVQVDSLLVGNTPLQRDSQYSVSGAVVTILDTLTSGAVIELNYWKANAVNATNYTKAESDSLVSNKIDKTTEIQSFMSLTVADYDAITNKSDTTIYFIE